MGNKIDLDVIITQYLQKSGNYEYHRNMIKEVMKEAIHQALILASEQAMILGTKDSNPIAGKTGMLYTVDKLSILIVEKLIVDGEAPAKKETQYIGSYDGTCDMDDGMPDEYP